jgi:hypothetical protein
LDADIGRVIFGIEDGLGLKGLSGGLSCGIYHSGSAVFPGERLHETGVSRIVPCPETCLPDIIPCCPEEVPDDSGIFFYEFPVAEKGGGKGLGTDNDPVRIIVVFDGVSSLSVIVSCDVKWVDYF